MYTGIFDWKMYVDNYEDLQQAGIRTEEQALKHWNRYGKREGRTFYKINKIENNDIFLKDIAVVTANFGNYDENKMDLGFVKNYAYFDWYYITDGNIRDSFWKVIQCDYHKNIKEIHNNDNSRMYSKFYKTQLLNIDIFKKYKYLIWIDSSYKITNVDFITNTINLIKNNRHSLYIFEHYKRDTLEEEYEESIKSKKYDNQDLKGQISKYMELCKTYKLYETGFFIYKNNTHILQMMNDWWNEIQTYSYQCQISLPYVLIKNNIDLYILNENNFIKGNKIGSVWINNFIGYVREHSKFL